jgi:hypothetical protein
MQPHPAAIQPASAATSAHLGISSGFNSIEITPEAKNQTTAAQPEKQPATPRDRLRVTGFGIALGSRGVS